jgi:magnesium-transporting ATPase (P-type)
VKLGDFQATVMGMLSAMLFFVISHAKPLEQLSPKRPHPNIFSAYVFLSLIGQFAANMCFLIYMYYGALDAMSKARPLLHSTPSFALLTVLVISIFPGRPQILTRCKHQIIMGAALVEHSTGCLLCYEIVC